MGRPMLGKVSGRHRYAFSFSCLKVAKAVATMASTPY